MDRVFLDANVLFSAAYRADAGLKRLWRLADIELITSSYALDEAFANLHVTGQRDRLLQLASTAQVICRWEDAPFPKGISLPEKDRPILQATIAANATHLLTGDLRDFGAYFGTEIEGVRILPPSDYLRRKECK